MPESFHLLAPCSAQPTQLLTLHNPRHGPGVDLFPQGMEEVLGWEGRVNLGQHSFSARVGPLWLSLFGDGGLLLQS